MPDELTPPGSDTAQAPALDVFISYSREDRDAAQALATALVDSGISVWWDRQIAGGQDYTDVIAERLAAARMVLVLWSSDSVASNFVRDEATRALDAGKLLPLRIEDVRPPLGFGTIQTLDLLGWNGDRSDPAWAELLANLRRGPGGLAQGLGPVLRTRWQRWRRPLYIAALSLGLVGGGLFGWNAWREQQAQSQFQQGLSAHFARDRNLQSARNAYLSALRNDPELGRAHYYLGHVYALLILPDEARTQFGLALRFARDLDEAQRADARVQLAALSLDQEAAPMTRASLPAPEPEPAPRPPATPAPAAPTATAGPGGATERAEATTVARAPSIKAAPAPRTREAGTFTSGHGTASPAPSPGVRARPTAPAAPAISVAPAPPAAPAAPVAVAHLPRLAPSPEQQRSIEAQVEALFAAPAQTRLSAATALALDPGLMADALPLAVERSLSALDQKPVSEAASAGATNTLQLLLGASPATLKAHREATLRLLDAVQPLGDNQRATALQVRSLLDKSMSATPPLAYIQIADESQRALALALAERIRASGYAVPAIENVGARAPARSEVRVQGGSTPGWGRWLAKIVGERSGEPARISTLRGARPANDSFEIWLEKDLCVVPQRRVPACAS